MRYRLRWSWLGAGLLAVSAAGCMSPFYADRGALFGGVTGAGVGALVGEAVGNPLAGAAIGAGVGTLTGAAVGSSLDEIEARNRAEIEARIGRPVPAGAVSVADVIAMTQAGVDENLIVQHIRIHGTAQVLRPGDLIQLQTNGVSARVVQAMQAPPQPRTVIHEVRPPRPRPIIIEERIYPAPWGPPRPLPPPW